MDPITMITFANAGIDLIIRLVSNLSGPKVGNLKATLIKAKAELDLVAKEVADYKVTY